MRIICTRRSQKYDDDAQFGAVQGRHWRTFRDPANGLYMLVLIFDHEPVSVNGMHVRLDHSGRTVWLTAASAEACFSSLQVSIRNARWLWMDIGIITDHNMSLHGEIARYVGFHAVCEGMTRDAGISYVCNIMCALVDKTIKETARAV